MKMPSRKITVFLAAGVVICVASVVYVMFYRTVLPSDIIAGTGRIDGDLVRMNAKYAGRIEDITVDDGDRVKAGEVLARLSADEIDSKIEALRFSIESTQAEIAALQNDTSIAHATLSMSYDLSGEKSAETIKNMQSANLSFRQKQLDYARAKNLYDENITSRHSYELAKLAYENAQKRYEALQNTVAQATTQEQISKTSLGNVASLKKHVIAKQKGLDAMRAQLKELLAMKRELTIVSPIDGYVVEKVANKGEVVPNGGIVVSLIDPKELRLKMYIDTVQNGNVQIGDKARIFLDGKPDEPIDAVVSRISEKAEFTPKDVSVRSDRIQRVFAIYVKPIKPIMTLKLGLPAVGVVSTDGAHLPRSAKELGDL